MILGQTPRLQVAGEDGLWVLLTNIAETVHGERPAASASAKARVLRALQSVHSRVRNRGYMTSADFGLIYRAVRPGFL